MNHTAWCKQCKRWRSWWNDNRNGLKRCKKCNQACVRRGTDKPARHTGIRFRWFLSFDPLTGVRKMVRWFSPTERFEQQSRG